MKIAVICAGDFTKPSGLEEAALRLHDLFVERGCESRIYSPKDWGSEAGSVCPWSDADIIQFIGYNNIFLLKCLIGGKKKGQKFVLSPHRSGATDFLTRIKMLMFDTAFSFLSFRVDTYAFASNHEKKFFVPLMWGNAKVLVVGIGVDKAMIEGVVI